jgi:hypothetical protein
MVSKGPPSPARVEIVEPVVGSVDGELIASRLDDLEKPCVVRTPRT